MPFIQDDWMGGLFPFREHNPACNPHNLAVRKGVQIGVQDDRTGEYTQEGIQNSGDWAGWQFWRNNPSFGENITAPVSGSATSAEISPRMLDPSDFMSGAATEPDFYGAKREIGSWSQCVPSFSGPQGLRPIRSKKGGADLQYLPKNLKTAGFSSALDETKSATGAPVAHGTPGLTVQCLNQDSHETLFFQSGGMLVADHSSNLNASTRVFRVKENGFIDTNGNEAAALDSIFAVEKNEDGQKIVAIVGNKSGKDTTGFGAIRLNSDEGQEAICYLAQEKKGPFVAVVPDAKKLGNNPDGLQVGPVQISSEALYKLKSKPKSGPLAFSDIPFPLSPQEGDQIFEVNLSWDGVRWRWWVSLDQVAASFARICWNFDSVDASEGEILDANFTPTGQRIWVDYNLSRAVQFRTAGDGAVFAISLVNPEFVRNGETRQLFRATSCVRDLGRAINFFEVSNKLNSSYFLNSDDQGIPWDAEGLAKIKTTIVGAEKDNILRVSVPNQWDYTNPSTDFRYLQAIDFSRGLDLVGAPITPTPRDQDFFATGIMDSAEERGGSPIATYKIKVN